METQLQPIRPQVDPLKQMVQSAFKDVTPVRLRLLFVANVLGATALAAMSFWTVALHTQAVRTVGQDAAPSVIAAHEIKIDALQMDNAIANELLAGPTNQESAVMAEQFEKGRQALTKQLVAAAKNITYGAKEQTPIENIQFALGKFEIEAQRARDLQKFGKVADSIATYRNARQTLEDHLLADADHLNTTNADVVESIYAQERSEAALARGFVLVLGILVAALLVYTQVYLAQRFRRRLNLPFIVATLATIAFSHQMTSSLTQTSHKLKIVKEDAYNSIVSLLDTRADAYDANAAQCRRLLDPKHADDYLKQFTTKTANVASFAPQHSFADTIAQAQKPVEEGERINLPGFSGSLADELGNLRFEGEKQAALETLEAFADYCAVDTKIRELESSGSHDAAVRRCLDYEPNGSKFAFTRFDDALQRTLDINEDQFQHEVKNAFASLKGLDILAQVAGFFIAACVYFGLRPRMSEYV